MTLREGFERRTNVLFGVIAARQKRCCRYFAKRRPGPHRQCVEAAAARWRGKRGDPKKWAPSDVRHYLHRERPADERDHASPSPSTSSRRGSSVNRPALPRLHRGRTSTAFRGQRQTVSNRRADAEARAPSPFSRTRTPPRAHSRAGRTGPLRVVTQDGAHGPPRNRFGRAS